MSRAYDPKQRRAHSPTAPEGPAPVDELLGATTPAEPPAAPEAPAPTPEAVTPGAHRPTGRVRRPGRSAPRPRPAPDEPRSRPPDLRGHRGGGGRRHGVALALPPLSRGSVARPGRSSVGMGPSFQEMG